MARTRRPDLEAQPFKAPNFIGHRLLPPLKRMTKQGRIYYQDIQTDAAAQTNRTLASAPTATAIASASDTWTATEAIKRYHSDDSEIEQLGGLAAAQEVAARRGKRSIMGTIEDAIIAAIFGSASITKANIMSSFLAKLQVAKETVMDNADGKVAIFGAARVIDRLKRYSEITDKMVYTGVPVNQLRDVRSISNEMLAAAIGVDEVLAGPSIAATGYTGWLGSASAYDGYVGVCVLPDPDTDPIEEVQFGRTCVMAVPADGNADNIFQVHTWQNDEAISETTDTQAWYNVKTLNLEACYILWGVDEGNATTTTSTTSTTT